MIKKWIFLSFFVGKTLLQMWIFWVRIKKMDLLCGVCAVKERQGQRIW